MKGLDLKLPSNRRFGLFFTFVFALASVYFYNASTVLWTFTFGLTSLIFLFFTLVKADILLPLNRLWMRFGLLLSKLVSPIVLGVIFFGLFTPIAFVMRIAGRDELRLKISKKSSYWISQSEPINSRSFRDQF